MHCRVCRFDNPPTASFCSGCGRRLDRQLSPAQAAELRPLCVLFCDLVGSTRTSQRLGAEAMGDLLARFHQISHAVVCRFDGYIHALLGDALVIYFGYPVAHEDEPSRAVLCALALQVALTQASSQGPYRFPARIGIHRGQFAIGREDDPGDGPHIVVGAASSIAARLQELAEPGGIVLSDSMMRLVGGRFRLESLGVRQLKGVERPLQLHRVLGVLDPLSGPVEQPIELVGRLSELQRILERWSAARECVPQVVLLTGEPGIGKTRLLQEVRCRVDDDHNVVLEARCSALATDSPLQVFVELLESRFALGAIGPAERRQRLLRGLGELEVDPADALPLLADLFGLDAPGKGMSGDGPSPAARREATFALLVEMLRRVALRAPVLLLIEDLHWADPSTLELISRWIAGMEVDRVMLLVSSRSGCPTAWLGHPSVDTAALGRLDDRAAESLVMAEARGKLLPLEALRTILQRGGGNPLFLQEVTRALLDTDPVVLVERDTTWELVGMLPSQAMPGSVEAAIVSRLDRLGDALSTLQLAAMVGDPFSAEILLAVQPIDAAVLRDRLGRLVAADLIASDPLEPSLFRFRHALIQDTAYGMMLLRRRQQYHRSLARLLQRQDRHRIVARPERVAHHLFHAESYAAAAASWLAAGSRAVEQGALSEANDHFGHALGSLELLPESAERRRQELTVLQQRSPVLMAIYGWASPLVAEACGRTLELLEQEGQHEQAFWPRFGLWAHHFVRGELEVALRSAEEIRHRADRSDRQALRLAACNAHSYTLCYRAEFEAAITAADHGLAIADLNLDQEVLSRFQLAPSIPILAARGKALWMRGQRGEGRRVIDAGVPYACSLQHLPSLAVALSTQVDLSGWMGDWQRLEERAAVLIELARSQGYAIWRTYGEMMHARARMELSDDPEAVDDVLRWSSLLRQTGTGFEVTTTAAMVCEAMLRRGQPAQALAVNLDAEEQARQGGVGLMLPELVRLRAALQQAVGDADGAAFSRTRALRLARDQGAWSLLVRALTDALRHGSGTAATGPLAEELAVVLEHVEATPACEDVIAAREALSSSPGTPFPSS